jgi:hypothetical protein
MAQDMLDLLGLDPGTRTMGELVQERVWAYGEIKDPAPTLARATGPRWLVTATTHHAVLSCQEIVESRTPCVVCYRHCTPNALNTASTGSA